MQFMCLYAGHGRSHHCDQVSLPPLRIRHWRATPHVSTVSMVSPSVAEPINLKSCSRSANRENTGFI
jgi:hypothetical protein